MSAEELLSLEALLVSRAYLYTLFHKAFGGEPDPRLMAVLGSPVTEDVLDEYAAESETLARLKAFCRAVGERADDRDFLEEARDEFNRFFVGPADLVALPWESTHVGNETMVFQSSTLAVREAYRTQGIEAVCVPHMPDDHVSIMCAFLAELARRTLAAFRAGDGARVAELLAAQRSFLCEHMSTWLPEYAQHALRVREAHLYPQLAQGIAAFVELDGRFVDQAMQWVEEVETGPFELSYDSATYFRQVDVALEELAALKLRGIEDNEISCLS